MTDDQKLDVSGRPTRLISPELEFLFSASSIAVVGATDTEGRQTTFAWRQLARWGSRTGAQVTPVHPTRESVDGVRTVTSLENLDHIPDVVAVLISDPLAAVQSAVEIGAKYVVVFAAGFSESGDAGKARQRALLDAIKGSETRLVGPNTNLNAFEWFDPSIAPKGLAILTQSGHQGRPLFLLQDRSVRITHWAPTGNEADIDSADLLGWFAKHPDVSAVSMYLEGIRDGRRFMLAAEAALLRGVPVVAIKVGKTQVGKRSAASHTGALTGEDRVVDAAFSQMGVQRVDDLDQLCDTSIFLSRAPAPLAKGVAVFAMSGGTCSHVSDLAVAAGLKVPLLTAKTQEFLRQQVPGFLSVQNPIDCGGPPMNDDRGSAMIKAILADERIGVIICAVTGPVSPFTDRFAADLISIASDSKKPVCVVWGSIHTQDKSLDLLLQDQNVHLFRSATACISAVASWNSWHEYRSSYTSPFLSAPRQKLVNAQWPLHGESSEWVSRAVLKKYGIRVSRAYLATSSAEAVSFASRIKGEVVIKADVSGLAHRARYGLVKTGLSTSASVKDASSKILRGANELIKKNKASQRLNGVIVAEQAVPGMEVLVGAVLDPIFGPTVTVGHGGVLTEVIDSVAMRVAPFTRRQAQQMLREVKGSEIWRDTGGADAWRELVDVVMKVQRMALDLGDKLLVIDINPVVVTPGSAIAVDAWIDVR